MLALLRLLLVGLAATGAPALRAGPVAAPVRLTTAGQAVLLNGQYRFKTEDHARFARLDFNDSSWPLIGVPSLWANAGVTHDGPGWYRIRFDLGPDLSGRELAVMTPNIVGAFEVYVNGMRLGGRGVVAPSMDHSSFLVQVAVHRIPVRILRKHNVLALRVRGYTTVAGIALHDFYLGDAAAVDDVYARYLIWNSVMTGISLIVGLYFLVLFLLGQQDRSYFFFSMLALSSSALTLATKTLDAWVSGSFLLHEGLIHASIASAPYFSLRFFQSFFDLPRRRLDPLLAYTGPLLLLIFVPSCFSREVYAFHVTYLFPAIFITGILVLVYLLSESYRAVRARKLGARTILIGFIGLLLTAVNDLLSHMNLSPAQRLYEEGFTFFTVAMAVALGIQLNTSLRAADRMNRELDSQVLKRTEDLRGAVRRADDALEEVSKLNEFNLKINETMDLSAVLDLIIEHVQTNFRIDGTMLHLADRAGEQLRFFKVTQREFHTEEQVRLAEGISFPMNNESGGLLWRLVCKGRPMYFPRFPEIRDPDDPLVQLRRIGDIQSAIIVPLIVQGRPIGVLFFTNFERKMGLTRAQIASIARYGEQIAGAVHGSSLLRQVESERAKSDRLLLNILPQSVADELKERGEVEPLNYDSVTVMFTDFVGFTSLAERLAPAQLIEELDGCFTHFDDVSQRHGLEKLKTIGDAYMCAGGLPAMNQTHAVDACLAAMEFQAFMDQMRQIKSGLGLEYWQLRVGLHTGPVTAGVVGKQKFAYDIWGDTVNVASRMESAGAANRVNISHATYELVKDFFACESRGAVEAKGKGRVEMYFLGSLRPELASDAELRRPNARFWEQYAAL